MLSLILYAALQAAPAVVTTAAVEPAPAEAPAEDQAEPQVQKPKKVCRMVADSRVGPLANRRKVCREVFDQDNG